MSIDNLKDLLNLDTITDLSLFWRILVDPCWGPDPRDMVKKEVSLWGKDGAGEWRRLHHRIFDMQVEIINNPQKGEVKNGIEQCQLSLQDRYLKVTDRGLSDQAGEMDLELGNLFLESNPVEEIEEVDLPEGLHVIRSYLSNIFEGKEPNPYSTGFDEEYEEQPRPPRFKLLENDKLYYVGENIRLETEFTADYAEDSDVVHPVFLYPKWFESPESADPIAGIVYVEEEIYGSNGNRKAKWIVSPDDYESKTVYLNGQHLLIISQDQNFEQLPGGNQGYKGQRYFEFLADTVPIRHPEFDHREHLFYTGCQVFYIGFRPEYEYGALLQGKIRRIMFDPHSSCYGC